MIWIPSNRVRDLNGVYLFLYCILDTLQQQLSLVVIFPIFSWYRSNCNSIILLYFISTLLIAFNLVITLPLPWTIVIFNPLQHIGEYVGSSGDISGSRHVLIDNIYRVSLVVSFFSIWITTAILINSYREKRVNNIVYWIILPIPIVYFAIHSLIRLY